MKLTQKSYDGHVVQLNPPPPPKKKKEKSHTQKQSKKHSQLDLTYNVHVSLYIKKKKMFKILIYKKCITELKNLIIHTFFNFFCLLFLETTFTFFSLIININPCIHLCVLLLFLLGHSSSRSLLFTPF